MKRIIWPPGQGKTMNIHELHCWAARNQKGKPSLQTIRRRMKNKRLTADEIMSPNSVKRDRKRRINITMNPNGKHEWGRMWPIKPRNKKVWMNVTSLSEWANTYLGREISKSAIRARLQKGCPDNLLLAPTISKETKRVINVDRFEVFEGLSNEAVNALNSKDTRAFMKMKNDEMRK